jgi:hypothetical protein
MTKSHKPSGGVKSDESGQRTWVWQEGEEPSTVSVRALGEGLSLDDGCPDGHQAVTDPYNHTSPSGAPVKRRTLDDMRALSAQITKSKRGK